MVERVLLSTAYQVIACRAAATCRVTTPSPTVDHVRGEGRAHALAEIGGLCVVAPDQDCETAFAKTGNGGIGSQGFAQDQSA